MGCNQRIKMPRIETYTQIGVNGFWLIKNQDGEVIHRTSSFAVSCRRLATMQRLAVTEFGVKFAEWA